MSALVPAPEGPEPEASVTELREALGIARASHRAAIVRVDTVHGWIGAADVHWPGEVWLTALSRAREVEVALWLLQVRELETRLRVLGEQP